MEHVYALQDDQPDSEREVRGHVGYVDKDVNVLLRTAASQKAISQTLRVKGHTEDCDMISESLRT